MMTRSGRLVLPDNNEAPTLEDIAWGLQHIYRFGAQTETPWNVLQHQLACEELARSEMLSDRILFFALMHDAHEAMTGDVPGTWKTKDLRQRQAGLDARIYQSLSIAPPSAIESEVVHSLDQRLLLAEARAIGVLGCYEAIMDELHGARADRAALLSVDKILAAHPTPESSRIQWYKNARAWVNALRDRGSASSHPW